MWFHFWPQLKKNCTTFKVYDRAKLMCFDLVYKIIYVLAVCHAGWLKSKNKRLSWICHRTITIEFLYGVIEMQLVIRKTGALEQWQSFENIIWICIQICIIFYIKVLYLNLRMCCLINVKLNCKIELYHRMLVKSWELINYSNKFLSYIWVKLFHIETEGFLLNLDVASPPYVLFWNNSLWK